MNTKTLRFLRLTVDISAALISSFSFFPTTALAEESPLCFMVKPSKQVVDLSSLCGKSAPNICQGSFDDEGVPVALSTDLARFEANLKKEPQQQDSEKDAAELVQAFLARVPFPQESKA